MATAAGRHSKQECEKGGGCVGSWVESLLTITVRIYGPHRTVKKQECAYGRTWYMEEWRGAKKRWWRKRDRRGAYALVQHLQHQRQPAQGQLGCRHPPTHTHILLSPAQWSLGACPQRACVHSWQTAPRRPSHPARCPRPHPVAQSCQSCSCTTAHAEWLPGR